MSAARAAGAGLLVALVLLSAGGTAALANGSKGKRVQYTGDARLGAEADSACRFVAELEPLLFRLATLADRYGVVRIAIRNAGARKLVLSLAADRMELLLPGGPRPAILDLATHDPRVWDGLPAELRAAIAYPSSVEAREEESVFVFVPLADTAVTLQGFRYTIASLPSSPVTIRDTTPVKGR